MLVGCKIDLILCEYYEVYLVVVVLGGWFLILKERVVV